MLDLTRPLVVPDLLALARELDASGGWEPFRPGVTAHWFYAEGHVGARAVLLRYEPGARVSAHDHPGYEHLLVLEGDQYDEDGVYPTGSFVVHPPGTRHSPGSTSGCLALLVYERAVHFVDQASPVA